MITMSETIAILFAVLCAFFFIAFIIAFKRKRFFGVIVNITLVMLLLAVFGLFGMMSITMHGYHVLTHEEVAAHVKVEPTDPQKFTARFRFNDGHTISFELAGDELFVDAHILKWKPIANFFGLHTSYKLDRVSGRYITLDDERDKSRTVFSVSQKKTVDIFDLRKKYPLLKLLVDTEYGSATFIMADKSEDLELRVSTTGLLIRHIPSQKGQKKAMDS
jgi:ABC-type lipoprotein release transport system permease subunit